jgi:PAS domain S-box-containing protein
MKVPVAGRTSILIVEDELIVAEHLREQLEVLGYCVAGVCSEAEEAVERAGALRPDLVLMDILLRGPVDGITAAERIRREFGLPVVYATAFADEATLSRAKIAEPFGYVRKPFDERDLRVAIEMALIKHRAESVLLRRVASEEFAAELTSGLVGVTRENAHARIGHALESVGRFVGVDRCFLHLFSPDGKTINEVYEWHTEELQPGDEALQGRNVGEFVWAMGLLREFGAIRLLDVSDLPPGAAAERRLWQRLGIQSLLIVPLVLEGALAGYIGLDTERGEKVWAGEHTRLLTLLGQVFANLLVRQRAEEALLVSEEKYRALVENLNDVVFSLDTNGYIVYISPSIERVAGYQPEEVIGEQFTRYIHPHDRDALVEEWTETSRGRTGHYEFRILTKEGEVRQVRTSSRVRYESGEAAGLTGILTDITEWKMAESALRESEERYRRLWQNSSDGLVLVDPETGYILDCNEEFLHQSGRSKEELLAMRIWDLRPAFMREVARKKFLEVREKGFGGSAELSFERAGGEVIRVDFLSSLIQLKGRSVIQSRCRRLWP